MVKSTFSLRKAIIGLIFLSPLLGNTQYPLGSASQNVVAYEYFQSRQYQSVISELDEKKPLSTDEEILLNLSYLKTGTDVSGEMERWIEENEKHPLQSLARFNYAQYAFFQKDSTLSRQYLATTIPEELSKEDKASYGFMSGVLSLQSQQYQNAQNHFDYAYKNAYDNADQLIYYQAFTYYHLNKLSEALGGFEQTKDHPQYGLSSTFFIAKILLESGQPEKVIALAQGEISDQPSITNSGFHQLIGEAYARQGDLPKADAYFEQAIKKHPSRPSSALFYQAGVSKFKLGNVDKALQYLTESGIGSGPYAQLSAFQLGRLHIKRKEFEKARNAYIEASATVDLSVKEESLYQVAVLSALLGRYTESITYSDDYLNSFPTGKWKGEIEELLAQSYVKTSNYDLAIALLERLGVNNKVQKEVYQKVTFQKGLLTFNDAEFEAAHQWFQKSLNYPMDQSFTNEARFYLGEIFLREGDYDNAIASYKAMKPVTGPANYGIGYAYYNQQNYGTAIGHFKAALQTTSAEMNQDAKLRLADCLYATKNYQEALTHYNALNASDYIIFQKGMILRNLNRNEEAISMLQRVSSKSGYSDEALFYKAQIEFESANFEKAAKGFTELINSQATSVFLPTAYLNRAISRSNLNQPERAKEDYQFVIQNHIQTEEAFSAILGLQELERKGVKSGNLEKAIGDYKKANPGDGSLEVVEFEAAKGAYFDLEYQQAADKLGAFLKEYPNSKFKVEAEYYLGDAYYRTEQLNEALMVFEKQKFLRNPYTGRVLSRLGEINFQLNQYEKSIESYRLLLDLNLSPKDNYNAREGLMSAYVESGRFSEAIQVAEDILNGEWKPINSEQKATLVKGKAYLALDNAPSARTEFQKLSKGQELIAAEASYLLGEIAYDASNYEESLDILFNLNARFGSYTTWVEKSYMLIADNYIAMDELFQAKATLRSIVQHSENEEMIALAQNKLALIEQSVTSDSIPGKQK